MEEKERIQILKGISKALMPKLPYHNFSHALEVLRAVNEYTRDSEVQEQDRKLLRAAAIIHDLVYEIGRSDNEERSIELAQPILQGLGYSTWEQEQIRKLILATKMPQQPSNELEQLICDADLDNLGREYFFERGERIREELGVVDGGDWYRKQLSFLRGHEYHSEIARKLRSKGKEGNIKELERRLGVS
jgi:predicted metal-dependent HD superfamily phosphohydrolase